MLTAGSLANDAVLREEDGEWTIQGDPTEAAFLVAEAKVGLAEARRSRFERVGEVPFTSERKLMSTLQSDSSRRARARGRHEGRARRPARPLHRGAVPRRGAAADGCPPRRDPGDRRAARRPRAADARRRLPAAACTASAAGRTSRSSASWSTSGMVGIIDPPRPEARAAIADAHAAGLRVLMITGDHPHTAARIAADLGIAAARPRVMTGGELEALDDEACGSRGPRRLRLRPRRTRAQAADRRRAAGRRTHRRDDRRRRQRRAGAQGGRHRRRDGRRRHRRGQGGRRHDPRRRQLRHDRQPPSARAAASSPTSASSCASCSRRTSARCSPCSSASCSPA